MPRLSGTTRLARLAAPLKPAEPPYHVASVSPGHASPGWYWRPAGVEHPAWLGYNNVHAEIALLALLERVQEAA